MTENLSEKQAKWLTYLVFILITMLTLVTGYHHMIVTGVQARVNELPEKFVRLERYKCDISDVKTTLNKMDTKLDKMMTK